MSSCLWTAKPPLHQHPMLPTMIPRSITKTLPTASILLRQTQLPASKLATRSYASHGHDGHHEQSIDKKFTNLQPDKDHYLDSDGRRVRYIHKEEYVDIARK